ncbi:MAG TPA: hypothetical protein VGJ33_19520 [Candidatus Angelobacter sp.]|jgi:hypothetical protein
MKRRNNDNSIDDYSTESGKSAGEQVAEEETEYQRTHQDIATADTPQMGGSRGETKLSGRAPNQSRSRQTVVDETVNVEGEKEPAFQNAGGGQPRQRANQQNALDQNVFEPNVLEKNPGPRGREDCSIRGRESGPVRGEDAGRSEKVQGITNRSSRQETQRQQKVAPKRAEGKPARGSGKRRAS